VAGSGGLAAGRAAGDWAAVAVPTGAVPCSVAAPPVARAPGAAAGVLGRDAHAACRMATAIQKAAAWRCRRLRRLPRRCIDGPSLGGIFPSGRDAVNLLAPRLSWSRRK
jgi:hypothetical protein